MQAGLSVETSSESEFLPIGPENAGLEAAEKLRLA